MAERRRYTKREKASAVTVALASSVQAASEVKNIPRQTIQYWMDRPEFSELRQKTREDLARGFDLLAHAAQQALLTKVAEMEARDLTVLLGVATDKAQLLSGAATARTERRDLTDILPDGEREALAAAVDGWLAGERTAEGAGVPAGPTGSAEVRQ